MVERLSIRAFAAALALGCVSACAGLAGTRKDAEPTNWTRILQVENRFAVYLSEPAPRRQGQLATFHLVYVYKPGEIFWEGREVGWQEYASMTVHCGDQTVRAGPRRRYGPEGLVLLEDEDQSFAPINSGTAVEAAASARCTGRAPGDAVSVADGPDWMDTARRLLTPAPGSPT